MVGVKVTSETYVEHGPTAELANVNQGTSSSLENRDISSAVILVESGGVLVQAGGAYSLESKLKSSFRGMSTQTEINSSYLILV